MINRNSKLVIKAVKEIMKINNNLSRKLVIFNAFLLYKKINIKITIKKTINYLIVIIKEIFFLSDKFFFTIFFHLFFLRSER